MVAVSSFRQSAGRVSRKVVRVPEKEVNGTEKVVVAATLGQEVASRQEDEHRLTGSDVALEIADLDEVVHVKEAIDIRQQ